MAAAATDYFQKVGSNTATTLSSPGYTIGNSSVNVASTTNWPTDTGVHFAIDETETVGGEEVRVDGTLNIFRGTVNGATQITNLTYVGGDANRNYSAGATTRVYIIVNDDRENRLVDGLLVAHDQDGTLKDDAVATANIADDAVTSAKLAPSKTTDANSWEVFDFGTWKEYRKQFGPYSPGAITGGAGAVLASSQSMPVGVAPNDVTLSCGHTISGGSNASQMYGAIGSVYDPTSTSTSYTFDLGLRNLTGASLTPTGVYLTVILVTK